MTKAVDWESRIGRRLRLRDLHVFFAVVQSGSMAKAATHLKITQPSVSKAIGDLEEALGVRLFDRSTRGVEPTIYGDVLVKCGSVVFDELRQGIRHIEFLADPTVGELRIGCPDDTRWARRRKIDLVELVNEPWIIPAPHTWSYKFLVAAFRVRGLDIPKASLVTLSEPLRCSLLDGGSFITVLPISWLRLQAQRYSLKALPVELLSPPWPIVILTLKNRTLSPVVERFIACAREVAKSLVVPP